MTEDFNGAQLKAVCVEAGMLALRRGGTELAHEDFAEGVSQVQAKKKSTLNYYGASPLFPSVLGLIALTDGFLLFSMRVRVHIAGHERNTRSLFSNGQRS